MSARDRLHLSWVGEDPRSGTPRNPSPVLAELLEWLRQALSPQQNAELDPKRANANPPWLVQAPLHAFGAAPRESGDAAHQLRFGPLFVQDAPAVPDPPSGDGGTRASTVRLDALLGWLRNPAQSLLRDRWRLRLNGLEDRSLPADEPLDAVVDRRVALWRRLLDEALVLGRPVPDDPSVELLAEGILPPGRIGHAAYLNERDVAERLREHATLLPPIAAGLAPGAAPVEFVSATYTLLGKVAPTYLHDDTLWLIEYSRRDAKHIDRLADQLGLMLRFALLALDPPAQVGRIRGVLLGPEGPSEWAAALDLDRDACAHRRAELVHIVDTLYGLAQRAADAPLAYFPQTTESFARDKDAESAWLGGWQQVGERDWSPGYAWLLAGDRTFWEEDDPAFATFAETAEILNTLASLPAGWGAAAGESS